MQLLTCVLLAGLVAAASAFYYSPFEARSLYNGYDGFASTYAAPYAAPLISRSAFSSFPYSASYYSAPTVAYNSFPVARSSFYSPAFTNYAPTAPFTTGFPSTYLGARSYFPASTYSYGLPAYGYGFKK